MQALVSSHGPKTCHLKKMIIVEDTQYREGLGADAARNPNPNATAFVDKNLDDA